MDRNQLRCYKKYFPFKLSTTSFIYPDQIIPNVEIKELKKLSNDYEVNYNIHLPVDIFLGDKDEEIRFKGISIVKKTIELTLPLNPSQYILHFEQRDKLNRKEDIKSWETNLGESLNEIICDGIDPSKIAIENLKYPFEWIQDLIKKFELYICIDIGHILLYKYDLNLFFKKYLDKTSVIHLHGCENGIDHLGIDRISESILDLIFYNLKKFNGIVSIEVFSIDELIRSLEVLDKKWIES